MEIRGYGWSLIWVLDDILKCSTDGTTDNYASSIRYVMGIGTLVPNKAFLLKPSNVLKEVVVNQNLKLIKGSFDAKRKVYLKIPSNDLFQLQVYIADGELVK